MKNYIVRQYYSTYCDFVVPAHSKEEALHDAHHSFFNGLVEKQEHCILDNLDNSDYDAKIICEED